jgi:hypothetical protein
VGSLGGEVGRGHDVVDAGGDGVQLSRCRGAVAQEWRAGAGRVWPRNGGREGGRSRGEGVYALLTLLRISRYIYIHTHSILFTLYISLVLGVVLALIVVFQSPIFASLTLCRLGGFGWSVDGKAIPRSFLSDRVPPRRRDLGSFEVLCAITNGPLPTRGRSTRLQRRSGALCVVMDDVTIYCGRSVLPQREPKGPARRTQAVWFI